MVRNQLATAADVIEALGGVSAVATLVGLSYRAVHNWKANGRFAAHTHARLKAALDQIGCDADDSLWGQS